MRWFLIIWQLLAATAWPSLASAEQVEEYAVKAAFIYNVARFSAFHEQNEGSIYLCVLGRDQFGPILKSFEGKPVGAMKIAVRYPLTSSEAMMKCHIVFISSSEADNLETVAEAARVSGILSVADTRGAARKGIMVELAIEDRRIVFEVNNASARAANITISSKVLRLAKAVY